MGQTWERRERGRPRAFSVTFVSFFCVSAISNAHPCVLDARLTPTQQALPLSLPLSISLSPLLRYVLSHYHKCKDSDYTVCEPICNAIRSSRKASRPVSHLGDEVGGGGGGGGALAPGHQQQQQQERRQSQQSHVKAPDDSGCSGPPPPPPFFPPPPLPQQQQHDKEQLIPLNPGEGHQASPEEQQVLVQKKQQQLLVLHHASKCTHVDGECPQGYRECKVMKELWSHIAKCRNQRCPYSHCVASRWDRGKEGGRETERLLGSSHFLLLSAISNAFPFVFQRSFVLTFTHQALPLSLPLPISLSPSLK